MHNANWDDLRYVLAVAEAGSVAAAARDLGVNHATVLRRVSAWEDANGAEVFERSAQGYRLRPERAMLIEAARNAAQAMETVARLMAAPGAERQEVLRVTSVDSLVHAVLAPSLARWSAAVAPSRVALLCTNARVDIARLHAEVSVRPAQVLPDEMSGTEAASLGFAVYAAQGAVDGWLAPTGTLGRSPAAAWIAQEVPPGEIVASADSFLALRDLAMTGAGRTILPCILGDRADGLSRVDSSVPPLQVPVWVACHRDLAGVPRIAALRRALAGVLGDASSELAG